MIILDKPLQDYAISFKRINLSGCTICRKSKIRFLFIDNEFRFINIPLCGDICTEKGRNRSFLYEMLAEEDIVIDNILL